MGPKFGPKLGFLAQIQVQRPVTPTLSLSINPNPRLTPSVLHILSGVWDIFLNQFIFLNAGGVQFPTREASQPGKAIKNFQWGRKKQKLEWQEVVFISKTINIDQHVFFTANIFLKPERVSAQAGTTPPGGLASP